MDQKSATTTPVLPALAGARESALARLAFGKGAGASSSSSISRHLAFLPAESLELDLSDPSQRAFGDYELVEQIGQGGMGIVYRAEQRSLARQVALKLLSAGPWASADFIGRFKREAQSAARMQHPNIVPIYEVGQHEELNYFTMRLVEGPSLAQHLRERGPMPGKDAARLLRTIAEAVDYAHRLGVLHLDLKPGNVLIDERGEPQVADFGLARRLDETLAADADEVSGTPSYMAPEQAQVKSRRLTPATDIWGLGAILYECLTGRPPFLGANAQDTLARVVRDEVEPPGALVPGLSPDLEAVCLRCLRKDPAGRYASARALADDLGRFLEDREVGVRPLGRAQRVLRWARREPKLAFAVAAAALALSAGIVATSLQWRRAEGNAEAARRSAGHAERSAASAREVSWRARREQAWRASAEGKPYAALTPLVENLREQGEAGAKGQSELDRVFVASILNTQPALIDVVAVGQRISAVAFAPDGAGVAVATDDGRVLEYGTADGKQRWQAQVWPRSELRNDASETYQAISRDELFRASAAVTPGELHYSPDGRYLIADTVGLESRSPHGVKMRRIDPARGAVDAYPEGYLDATYSADGGVAIFRDGNGEARSYALDPLRPTSAPVRLQAQDWLLSRDGSVLVTIAAAGTRIEIRDGRTLAARRSIALPEFGAVSTIALSPDGSRLAYTLKKSGGALVDTGNGKVLATLPSYGVGVSVTFSEDGEWLFCAEAGGLIDARTGRNIAALGPATKSLTNMGGVVSHAGGFVLISQYGEFLVVARAYPSPGLWGDLFEMQARVAARQQLATSGFDLHQRSLLVATGDVGGELRLWRLRPSPAAGIAAPQQAFEEFSFDGTHLPDVRGDTVVVREAANARAASGAMRHGDPVLFAQLAADGETLVSAAGRRVHVWNWKESAPRFDPIELDALPLRIALGADGRRLVVTCGRPGEQGFIERIRVFDLRDGHQRGEPMDLAGPLQGARINADSSAMLAFRGPTLSVFDLEAMRPAFAPIVYGDQQHAARITRAAFSGDGSRIVAMVDGSEPAARLHWLDAKLGTALGERATGIKGAVVAADSRAAMVALQHPNYATLRVEHLAADTGEQAHSFEANGFQFLPGPGLRFEPHDRWAAHGGFGGAVLLDRGAMPITLSLKTGKGQHDELVRRIAFSADGMRLALQTTFAEYGYWALKLPVEDVDDVGRIASLYVPDPKVAQLATDAGLRRLLRSLDPGPPTAEQRVPTEMDELPRWSTPPRDPRAGAGQLDLGAHYNTPMTELYNDLYPFTDFRAIPNGLVRLDGVDYDLRGAVQLVRQGERLGTLAFPARAGPIPLPASVARVHALALQFKKLASGRTAGHVVLNYRDGSHARLPITCGPDVLPLYEQGELLTPPMPARIAWVGRNTISERSTDGDLRLYHVALDNPHPERPLRSLSLEASDEPDSAPMFFALTVDEAAQPGQERQP